MEVLPLNYPVIFGREIAVRKQAPEVSLTDEQTKEMLEQILRLLKTYNENEEQLINIPCKINDKNISSYQLGFVIRPNSNNNEITLALYIKRKDGTTSDKNPYSLITLNKSNVSNIEIKRIKDFLETGILSLILETEYRELAETPFRYRTD